MRERNCQSIGRISGGQGTQAQQSTNHQGHLTLFRPAASRNDSLDLGRCVLEDLETSTSQDQQRHSASMTEFGRSLWVFVEEERLHSPAIWPISVDDLGERGLQGDQALGKLRLLSANHAVAYGFEPRPGATHQTPAKIARTRIYPEHQHGAVRSSQQCPGPPS